jgi:predicted nucleic acid-binding protein
VLVIDASVLVVALGDDGEVGASARARLTGEQLAAPELIDLEVASVLRRQVVGGGLSVGRATEALSDLRDMAFPRAAHLPLLSRCWELRDNLTVYDAAYVALAELLQAPLLTADARMASAPGINCEVEVFPAQQSR